MDFFIFFYGSFLPSWIRIRIRIPGTDPLTWLNPDPIRIRVRNTARGKATYYIITRLISSCESWRRRDPGKNFATHASFYKTRFDISFPITHFSTELCVGCVAFFIFLIRNWNFIWCSEIQKPPWNRVPRKTSLNLSNGKVCVWDVIESFKKMSCVLARS